MISVIIPVYNVEHYLRQCIESVLNQTEENLEIILVDDGSTDDSGKICDYYAGRDQRIRVIHQKNAGNTNARNTGLLASKGEYIGFVDSDDWIESDMYENMLSLLLNNDVDIVICQKESSKGAYSFKVDRGIQPGIYNSNSEFVARNLIYLEDYSERGFSPNLYDKLFRRELVMQYQMKVDPETKYGEDDICSYLCILNSKTVYVTDRIYYHYRERMDSICHSSDERYFERNTIFYNQLMQEFNKHIYKDILIEQLKYYMLEFVIRGINLNFGFGFGTIFPIYKLPLLKIEQDKRYVIYGAGKVGQDYYESLKAFPNVVWVDKAFEKYQKDGLCVINPEYLFNNEVDVVIIAVENRELAHSIKEELLTYYKLEINKIYWEKPISFIEHLAKRR